MTRDAFNEIVHTWYKKLYLVAFRIVRNKPEAEDTVQETFLKLWKMGKNLDEYNDIEALAVTIVKNRCIDIMRKRSYAERAEDGSSFHYPDLSASPYDQMVQAETIGIVHEIISELPAGVRELIQMREIEGISYEEIAARTGSNINSIRVSVSRARQIIKDKYLNYLYERGASERVTGKVL
ncbi:MAG: sigma-70 family RNA polymerase sigma factor [Bacteroidales bacterium]|jgi:RNA polymerase sigma-70 factor (ECF subfamily)